MRSPCILLVAAALAGCAGGPQQQPEPAPIVWSAPETNHYLADTKYLAPYRAGAALAQGHFAQVLKRENTSLSSAPVEPKGETPE